MAKGALIDRPTDEEISEFGAPPPQQAPGGISMASTEDMNESAPPTWREVLDAIGAKHKAEHGFDDKFMSVFSLPEPIIGESGKPEPTYFFDGNNTNLHYRARISAETLSKRLMNRRLQAYEWSFQVAINFLTPDRDENGVLREGVIEMPASQDVEVMTEYGTRIQIRRDGMRVIRSNRIAGAYVQDIIHRTARWFVAEWVPKACRARGVAPPRIKTQDNKVVWVPEGTEIGRHAHEVFRTLLY